MFISFKEYRVQLFSKNFSTIARYLLGGAVAVTVAAGTATLAGMGAGLLASQNVGVTETPAVYPKVVIWADNPVDDSGLDFFDLPDVDFDDPTDFI